jgi:protein ImuB
VIVCVHLPRFALSVAAGGVRQLGERALAITPAGGAQVVGEVSPTAQAKGVAAGMRLGEALARCPELVLVPDDPVGVAQAWERVLVALEGIGARVEAPRSGLAFFDAAGLRSLHRDHGGVLAVTRASVERPSRIGVGATRFIALAASLEARARRSRIVEDREARRYLAARPITLLSYREQTAPIVPALQQFGLATLGQLAALPAGQLADRFGQPGLTARRFALGHDEPLRPRRREERLQESMSVGELNSHTALARTLGVLIDRLLTRRERHGRTIRAVTLSAQLVEHAGTWADTVVFREALANRHRMYDALQGKLALLPAPATALTLTVAALGPAGGDQTSLLDGEQAARRERLRSAVAQVRTVAGPYAALRVVLLNPRARVPERTHTHTPFLP